MLIGLTGPAGVGKTTIAREITKQIGGAVLSYAAPMKMCLSVMTGLSMEYFTDIKLKEKVIPEINKTPRQLMQLFGTEFARKMIVSDFWIWRMLEELKKFEYSHVYIDDIRFENEASLVRNQGGTVVHLKRNYKAVTTETGHASEQPIIVQNNDIYAYIDDMTPEESARSVLSYIGAR